MPLRHEPVLLQVLCCLKTQHSKVVNTHVKLVELTKTDTDGRHVTHLSFGYRLACNLVKILDIGLESR